MRATIDSAGRLVVPKTLREALGFRPGQELELTAVDDRLEVAAPATAMRLETREGEIVAVPDTVLPPLTGDIVRDTLERTRR